MNSLYGRFGLNPIRTTTRVVTPAESEIILKEHKNVEINYILLSGKVVITYQESGDADNLPKLNMSIGIASAISAYSRIIMSDFIRKFSDNILAIDTDGIKLDRMLPSNFVDSKELGKMKFEYHFLEGVFPIPKVYGGLLSSPYKKYENEMVKIKGLKNPVYYFNLKMLLNRDANLVFDEDR